MHYAILEKYPAILNHIMVKIALCFIKGEKPRPFSRKHGPEIAKHVCLIALSVRELWGIGTFCCFIPWGSMSSESCVKMETEAKSNILE
jgi:hypothetical protein